MARLNTLRMQARFTSASREYLFSDAVIISIVCLHLALGLACRYLPGVATLHAFVVLVGALGVAIYSNRVITLLMAMSYIAGSEVLWRMSGSVIFHETAKYVVVFLAVLCIWKLKLPRLSLRVVLYLALLLPAVIVPIVYANIEGGRKMISFTLSGPMALMAMLIVGMNIQAKAIDVGKVLFACAAPVVSVLAITLKATYASGAIRFATESNKIVTAGFGPNQVSSTLGIVGLLLLLIPIALRQSRKVTLMMMLMGGACLAQSMMTFSRSGIVAVILLLPVVAVLLFADVKIPKWVMWGGFTVLVALPLAVVGMNYYTNGKLIKRFSERKMSGREELAMVDLKLWGANPVFGVGVGVSAMAHPEQLAAHTEYSRAVAEHGVLGAIAYVLLISLCFERMLVLAGRRQIVMRSIQIALLMWPLLYMLVNGMRTVMPAWALGIGFVNVLPGGQRARE